MKNKKAQLGKGIMSLPVMIIIIVIMGIFIFLSASASLFNSDTFSAADSIHPESSLLLKTIQIELNSQKQQVLVFDAVTLMLNGYIPPEQIRTQLEPLVTKENNCLMLRDGSEIIIGVIYVNDAKLRIKDTTMLPGGAEQHITIWARNKNHEISSYFGKCKETKNE